jgi:hypothetical protein
LFGAREDAAAGALKLTKTWLHTSKLGQPGYTVTFTTSNIMGAGTAARVSLGAVYMVGPLHMTNMWHWLAHTAVGLLRQTT